MENVFAGHDWELYPEVVLDGLRHAEVRHALIVYLRKHKAVLKVVYVKADESLRQVRAVEKGVPLRLLATYDQDLTETQVYKVIPAYADITVEAALPPTMAVDSVLSRLGRSVRPAEVG